MGAFSLALDEARGLQPFQVLTPCGLSQGQDLDNFVADEIINGLQVFDDPNPGRMPQRFAILGKTLVTQGRCNLLSHRRFGFVDSGCALSIDR